METLVASAIASTEPGSAVSGSWVGSDPVAADVVRVAAVMSAAAAAQAAAILRTILPPFNLWAPAVALPGCST